jgi:hypothetical protein
MIKDMTLINDWKDVSIFTDKIVAWKCDNSYFMFDYCFHIGDVAFGFIEAARLGKPFKFNSECGYILISFMKSTNYHSTTALVNSQLYKKSFMMRLATKDEGLKLIEAVSKKNAYSSYGDEQAYDALNRFGSQ